MALYNTILVPLDGSALAERAASHAAELARLCGARLIFYRVAPDQDSAREAAEYLARVNEEALAEGIRAECVVGFGAPAAVIVKAAVSQGVDLILISSHGRTGVARQVFGSVAEEVVRTAHCPVTVVKVPRGDGEAVRRAS